MKQLTDQQKVRGASTTAEDMNSMHWAKAESDRKAKDTLQETALQRLRSVLRAKTVMGAEAEDTGRKTVPRQTRT